MKIGIESGAYLSRYGLAEGLKRMRKHGYECVDFQDFANTEGPLFQLDEPGFEKELKNIRKQIEDSGSEISQTQSSSTPLSWILSHISTTIGKR